MTSLDFATLGCPKMKYSEPTWGNDLHKDACNDSSSKDDNHLLWSYAGGYAGLLRRRLQGDYVTGLLKDEVQMNKTLQQTTCNDNSSLRLPARSLSRLAPRSLRELHGICASKSISVTVPHGLQ